MIPPLINFAAASCSDDQKQKLLGLIPKWYEYLSYTPTGVGGRCEIQLSLAGNGINAFWLIALAALDILFRLAGLIAVGYIIYGGIRYITSEGQPENTKNAMSTIINAVIGLAITIAAAAVVSFIGARLQ